MRIKIFAAMHGRQEIVDIFRAGVERLQSSFDCDLFVVCSDDEDAMYCDVNHVKYAKCPNDPISDKHNYGVKQALLDTDWTHLLIMGSDDVITNDGLRILSQMKPRHAGFYGGLFYNTQNGDCKHWDYPRDLNIKRLFGAGRIVSRELIEYCIERQEIQSVLDTGSIVKKERKMVPRLMAEYLLSSKRWKKMEGTENYLWEPGIQKGLDVSLETMLVNCGAPPIGISGIHVCDFKSKNNLWRYEERDGTSYSFDDFAKNLSEKELELINKIKNKEK
jgi:hypothetical protein